MTANAEAGTDAITAVPSDNNSDSLPTLKARGYLRPLVQASLTMMSFNRGSNDFELTDLMSALYEQIENLDQGDLGRAEEMLLAQAHSLDALCNMLLQDAVTSKSMDAQIKLALRAQNQCRATLETLVNLKKPKSMSFFQQANIAHGPQQVNNGVALGDRQTHNENGISKIKLMGNGDEQRLDTGKTSAPGRAYSTVETVASIDRAKNA